MPKASEKAKKTATAMPKRLAAIRQKLVDQRQEILDMYENDLRIGQQSSDEASEDIVDRANNAYQREFMFSLSDTERKLVLQIEQALKRLDAGGYGVCDHCGEKIGAPRLKAIPWARYCIDCQEKEEQGSLE